MYVVSSSFDHLIRWSSHPLIISSFDHLMHWSSHPLIIPCIDHLMHWSSHPLIISSIDHLIHWSSHPLILSSLDPLIPWSSHPLIISSLDHLIHWSSHPLIISSISFQSSCYIVPLVHFTLEIDALHHLEKLQMVHHRLPGCSSYSLIGWHLHLFYAGKHVKFDVMRDFVDDVTF